MKINETTTEISRLSRLARLRKDLNELYNAGDSGINYTTIRGLNEVVEEMIEEFFMEGGERLLIA